MTESKICKHCNKKFFRTKEVTQAWNKKRYCNEECRKAYYKSKNKNCLKETYHDKTLALINKIIKGRINFTQSNPTKENSDIETTDINYELEVYHLKNKWRKKYTRHYDKDKKHILILSVNPELAEYFDEVWFAHKNNITKVLRRKQKK